MTVKRLNQFMMPERAFSFDICPCMSLESERLAKGVLAGKINPVRFLLLKLKNLERKKRKRRFFTAQSIQCHLTQFEL